MDLCLSAGLVFLPSEGYEGWILSAQFYVGDQREVSFSRILRLKPRACGWSVQLCRAAVSNNPTVAPIEILS